MEDMNLAVLMLFTLNSKITNSLRTGTTTSSGCFPIIMARHLIPSHSSLPILKVLFFNKMQKLVSECSSPFTCSSILWELGCICPLWSCQCAVGRGCKQWFWSITTIIWESCVFLPASQWLGLDLLLCRSLICLINSLHLLSFWRLSGISLNPVGKFTEIILKEGPRRQPKICASWNNKASPKIITSYLF